jgi:uncharacterized phiE125 gp8 family phage protein
MGTSVEMTLSLITPPATPLVPLADLKAHLRIDSSDEDALIAALESAVVGYLDGWKGVLGRAMLQQVWRQEFAEWGDLPLALPDVSAVAVTYLDANGDEQAAASAVLRQTTAGPVVAASGPDADRIFVNMTCAMSTQMLSVAQMIVRMFVAHWYENRVTIAPGAATEMPLAATALIGSLRWGRI